MKVFYYCQHVLGIGHFHRSVEICKAIAQKHKTTLILGGPPVAIAHAGIGVLRLPGLKMDNEFKNLVPWQKDVSLDEVKATRKENIYTHFQHHKPDIFITELYPFGRKAFRFELDPLLSGIRDGSMPKCLCYCSVRDILVEKNTGREKFERQAVQRLNAFFDGILVHADPQVITLDETFGMLDDIHIPLHYTGFVTPAGEEKDKENIREKLFLDSSDKLIVASIGGGNVGSELLFAVIRSFKLLSENFSAHLQLFCGPYCDDKVYEALQNFVQSNISVDRFTDQFPEWLAASDLSVSMAGYNTCMNLVQASIPALVYPFNQNREQQLRAERLGEKTGIRVLNSDELEPNILEKLMQHQLKSISPQASINLDGAAETARQLTTWSTEQKKHD